MSMRHARWLALLLAAGLAVACGQSGPLVLPESAAPASSAAQSPEDADDEDEDGANDAAPTR